jgi:hypothetical protein
MALVFTGLLMAPSALAQRRHHRNPVREPNNLRPRPAALSIAVAQSTLSNGLKVVCSADPAVAEMAVSLLVPLGTAMVADGFAQRVAAQQQPELLLRTRVVLEEELTGYVTSGPVELLDNALSWSARRISNETLQAIQTPGASAAQRAQYMGAYSVGRAVVSVVSPTECSDVLSAIRRYFEVLSPRQATALPWLSRGDTVPSDQRQRWSISGSRTPDHYALSLAASALCDALQPPTQRANALLACATLDRSTDEQLVVGVLDAQTAPRLTQAIARLATEGPGGAALERVLNAYRVRYLRALELVDDRAFVLGRFSLRSGDAALVNTELDRYESVRVQDIQRVVATYLRAQTPATGSERAP